RVEQLGLIRLDSDPVELVGHRLADDHRAHLRVLGDDVGAGRAVVEHRVDVAVRQRLEGQRDLVVADHLHAGDVLARPDVAGRPGLDAHAQPSQVVHRADFVRAGFQHGDRLPGVEVRVGEVDDFLALVGDGGRAGDHVELTGLQRDEDAVPAGVDELDVEARFLGDGVHQVHVEPDDVAVFVDVLERRIFRVHADGDDAQFALHADRGVFAFFSGLFGRFLSGRARAVAGLDCAVAKTLRDLD